jgi:hypothetical protein
MAPPRYGASHVAMPPPRDGPSHVPVLIVFKKYGLEMNWAKIIDYNIK